MDHFQASLSVLAKFHCQYPVRRKSLGRHRARPPLKTPHRLSYRNQKTKGLSMVQIRVSILTYPTYWNWDAFSFCGEFCGVELLLFSLVMIIFLGLMLKNPGYLLPSSWMTSWWKSLTGDLDKVVDCLVGLLNKACSCCWGTWLLTAEARLWI